MKRKNTVVKIEAHGHLGDYSKEYSIWPGDEENGARLVVQAFIDYVLKGGRARYKRVLDILVELQKIEQEEASKGEG